MKILFLITLLFADVDLKNKGSLLKALPHEIEWNSFISLEPLEGHHINLKSPNSCGQSQLLSTTEQKVECKMTHAGYNNIEVFVCDDAKTFCKREAVRLSVHHPRGIGDWTNYIKSFF